MASTRRSSRLFARAPGRPLPSFESQTVDGQPFSSRDFVGKPVIVNFFAGWCPVCSMELKDLQTLHPDLRQRGVSVIEVLVDRWRRRTPSMRPASSSRAIRFLPRRDDGPGAPGRVRYEGFPATYFVKADGTFSTTLFGYQPIEQAATGRVGDRRGRGRADGRAAVLTRPICWHRTPSTMGEAAAPRMIPAPWAQWHPLLVHFPIALLVIEAVFVWRAPDAAERARRRSSPPGCSGRQSRAWCRRS